MFYYQRAVPIGRTRSSQCSLFAIETLSHNTLTILIHPSLLPLRTRLTARISRCIFLCSNALLYAYSSFCVMQIWSLDSHSVSTTINIIAANWNVHDGVVGMVHPIYISMSRNSTPQITVEEKFWFEMKLQIAFFHPRFYCARARHKFEVISNTIRTMWDTRKRILPARIKIIYPYNITCTLITAFYFSGISNKCEC